MELKLKLQRPIVFFDIETTGLSITQDRIIELSYIKIFPDGREQKECLRINPGMPIPKASFDVHHISDDDVRDCPSFGEVAQHIFAVFNECYSIHQHRWEALRQKVLSDSYSDPLHSGT